MATPSIPRRPLMVLCAAVFAAHLLVLQAAPSMVETPDPATTRAWTTRTIVLTPVQAVAAATPAVAPLVAPAVAAAPPRPQPVQPRIRKLKEGEQTALQSSDAAAAVAQAVAGDDASPRPAASPSPSPPSSKASATPALPAEETPPTSSPPHASPAHSPVSAAAPASPPPRESAPGQTTAFTVPGSVRLKFNVAGQVRQINYEARGELLWLHDGSTYDARMEITVPLLGSRIQTSSGRIGAQGLAPLRFADKARSEVAAHFDRNSGRVTFSSNTPEVPLLPGVQDRLSVLLQLASMLAGNPARYAAATTISVQTIGPRDANIWVFTVEGEEKIRVADTEYSTLRLTRNPRGEFDLKVQAWFAPQLGYLPVRIRIVQPNGDFVDQQLQSVEKP